MAHLTSIHDLSDGDIAALLDRAALMEKDPRGVRHLLDGRVVCTAFFEPSTRTRLSFESAAQRLGASVIGFSDPATTSSSKGETLEDTIRMIGGYSDLIVMRHPKEGAARRAAAVSPVPVVNAGDGPGEHPTQTLLDVYTMRKEKGRIEGLRVGLVGDLRYGRTVHSLVPALQRLGANAVAVAAPGLELPKPLAGDVPTMTLEEAAGSCDVLYVTRVQKERFADPAEYEKVKDAFVVDADLLQRTKSRAIVMHPLPRVDEVHPNVDGLPAAKYFEQARNGVPVRMAVLASLLEPAKKDRSLSP
ncbi:MAG TPA: aspartate carbamoyltransferase [Candidatus Thermoplasmatota archaeon]|nr:aspartate carbamoyltransferase [Candidatus Thermoplasmatota archaeon]